MKSKKPSFRFAEFNEEWSIKKLNELVDIVSGGTPDTKKNEYWDGDIDWYSPTEIGKSVYVNESVKKITKLGLTKSSAKILPADKTVLFTSRAGIGDMAILKKEGATNQGFQSLIVKDITDIYFLFSIGKKIKNFALKNASGSTFLEISGKNLGKMLIHVPVLDEQKKIGLFFKNLDDTIALHQQELAVLKQTKQGFLQKMFPEEGMTIPEIRFPEFYEQWELKTLGEVLDSIYNGQTPSRNRKDFWNGNINWLSSGELNRGVVKTTIEKITEFGQRNANLKIVPQNTFVIAITGLEAAGTRGNCAILGMETTLNQSCMALFPKKNLLDTTFLFQWYRKVGENYGLKFTQGTKQQSYNAEIIKKLEICLPSVEEQVKIGEFFKQLDEVIEMKEKELEALKETKKGFLQKMFV